MNRLSKFVWFSVLALFFQTQLVFAQTQTSGITPCATGATLSVSVASSNTQLSTCGSSVIIWNTGANDAFLNWGTASTTAAVAATGWAVPAGTSMVLNTGRAGLYLAAITSSSTTTLRLTQGNGNAVIAGGSGGGGSSTGAGVTATAADPSYVEGSTNNPLSSDLSGHVRVVASGIAQGSTTSGQTGSLVMGAVTTAAPSYTTAQSNSLSLTTTGALRVDVASAGSVALDPCQAVAPTYTPISITSATTTRIIAPAASKKTYICQIFMLSAIANNIGVVEGTGGTCGSGTAGVIGGTTAANGVNLAANSGFAIGQGAAAVVATAGTNVDLCLITSAAGPLAGTVKWVQQ